MAEHESVSANVSYFCDVISCSLVQLRAPEITFKGEQEKAGYEVKDVFVSLPTDFREDHLL